MARIVEYSGNKFQVDNNMSLEDIQKSLIQLFPETKRAVFLEKEGVIHVVLQDRMRQNLLDMELRNAKIKKMQRDLEQALERKREAVIKYGYQMSHAEKIAYIEEARQEGQEKIRKVIMEQEYPYKIGGHYASKGNYQHIVGKGAKVLEENVELGAYIVKVEGDDEEYLIRQKDIILKEMDEV